MSSRRTSAISAAVGRSVASGWVMTDRPEDAHPVCSAHCHTSCVSSVASKGAPAPVRVSSQRGHRRVRQATDLPCRTPRSLLAVVPAAVGREGVQQSREFSLHLDHPPSRVQLDGQPLVLPTQPGALPVGRAERLRTRRPLSIILGSIEDHHWGALRGSISVGVTMTARPFTAGTSCARCRVCFATVHQWRNNHGITEVFSVVASLEG